MEYLFYSFYEKRLFVLQMKFIYIRYVFNIQILKFNNFSEKIYVVGLGFVGVNYGYFSFMDMEKFFQNF